MDTRSVGLVTLSVTDTTSGTTFPTWVFYPTGAVPEPVTLGPFTLEVARGAPVADGRFPVIVVSHGTGGMPLLYRRLATHLAAHGYLVALPEHPGNNRNDNRLADTDENLVNRPRHVGLVLDAVSTSEHLGPHVVPDRAGIIGHSMGAYTALAAAGGIPWSRTGNILDVRADPRVTSLVLLAPVAYWYVPENTLKKVTAPILVYGGDEDIGAPTWHAHLILAQVPDKSKVTYRLIEGAGHYSFLSPYPAAMKTPGFVPATDPEGFDREKFHDVLDAEVLAFLERTLPNGS